MRANQKMMAVVGAVGLHLVVSLMALVPPEPAGATPAQAPAESRLLLNHEHVDALAPVYEDGVLSMRAYADLDSASNQVLEPSDVLFQLKDIGAARAVVPDVPEYAFLGPPGTPIWLAPEVQDSNLLWPGWTGELLPPGGAFVDDLVHLHLRDVEGPGNVELFAVDPGGLPMRTFSSTDPTLRSVPMLWGGGSHRHSNWAFDALGTYTLTFEATATTVDGAEVTTGPVEYRWLVGSVPTTTDLSVSPGSAVAGDDVTLTATVGAEAVPEAGLAGSVAFLDGGAVVGAAPVEDGTATLVTDDLAAGPHQLVARFEPDPNAAHSADAVTGSESAPVAYTVGAGNPDPPGECGIEVVLDAGHVDVAARIVDGDLVTQIKDGTQPGPPVWRDLDTVAFHVKPEAKRPVPSGAAFGFLGPLGSDIWVIPQVQDPAVVWAGWNTEEIDYDGLDGGVSWSLDELEGPGDLALYTITGPTAPRVLFDSSDPLPQAVALDLPTHGHGNWAFDTEGIYRLSFGHTAMSSSGGELSSEGTLAVAVGDVDLDDLCPDGEVPPPSDPPDPPGPPPGEEPPDTSAPAAAPPEEVCTTPAESGSGSTPTEPVVLDQGHVDYAARLVDGDLRSQVKDGTVAGVTEWRDPSDVVFHVKPEAATDVPGGEQYAFLGAPSSTVWQIPQTQDPDLLWLGWNTEEITASQVTGPITWTLDAVDGPGELAVYTVGSFGEPTVIFDSDGAADAYQVPLGTHAHGNWAFTAEGVYRLTFTHQAELASGQTASDTQTVTFAVGATDPSSVSPSSSTPTTTTTTTTPNASGSSDDCQLPQTGSDLDIMTMLGGLLLGGGSATTAAARRRRRRARPAAPGTEPVGNHA